jgi:protein phosphatase
MKNTIKSFKIYKSKVNNGSHQPSWQIGVLSEKGPVREENQDRMCGIKVKLGQVYIVADGMGGHKGGARAAQLVVDELCRTMQETSSGVRIPDALHRAFSKTNYRVYQAHPGNRATHRMGATAVVLLINKNTAYVAHVGDSRAYLYRDGRLRLLTRDHTRAERMVAAGVLAPEQAREHPGASILERAMGIKPDVEADISKGLKLKSGDGFLLCSDGLSGFVSDGRIQHLLNANLPVDQIPRRLYKLALQNGSNDNITIQYIKMGAYMRAQSKPIFTLKTAALMAVIGLLAVFTVYQQLFSTKASLKAQLAQQEQAYAKIQEEMVTLQGQKQEYNNQLKGLNDQQASLIKQIERLKLTINQTENDIKSAEKKKKEKEATVKNLKKQIEQKGNRQ